MAKILVVDDSRFQRNVLQRLLTDNGHEAILAENGADAFEKLEEHPDMVLCDLVMPVLDGFGFLEKLSGSDLRVPTIIVSADIQDSARERCMGLGAAMFLNKPVNEDTLLEHMGALLSEGKD